MRKKKPEWLTQKDHKRITALFQSGERIEAVKELLKIANVHTINPKLAWCVSYLMSEPSAMDNQPKKIEHIGFSLTTMKFTAH